MNNIKTLDDNNLIISGKLAKLDSYTSNAEIKYQIEREKLRENYNSILRISGIVLPKLRESIDKYVNILVKQMEISDTIVDKYSTAIQNDDTSKVIFWSKEMERTSKAMRQTQESIKDAMEVLGLSHCGSDTNIKLDLFSNTSILNQSFENVNSQDENTNSQIVEAEVSKGRNSLPAIRFE